MSTLHRRDISREELTLLARFCRALQVVENSNASLLWYIGEVEILLPVWYQAGSGWQLSNYKPFVREVVGLEPWAFRKICRYLQVREPELIKTLYRLSILAVVPGQLHFEPPKFKMRFCGEPIRWLGAAPPADIFGFVLERRRVEGNFK